MGYRGHARNWSLRAHARAHAMTLRAHAIISAWARIIIAWSRNNDNNAWPRKNKV